MRIKVEFDYSLVHESFTRYFQDYSRSKFFLSQEWFESIHDCATEKSAQARFYIVYDDLGQLRCILPARTPASKLGSILRHRSLYGTSLSGLTSNKTICFSPVFREDDPHLQSIFLAMAQYLRDERPAWAVIDFAAMVMDATAYDFFKLSFQMVGFQVREYNAYSNWYEPVRGSFEAYLHGLPKKSKKAIQNYRRKYKKNVSSGKYIIKTHHDYGSMDDAYADYEHVFRQSWKNQDPHTGFMARMFRRAHDAGVLRLVCVCSGHIPVAVDLALLHNGNGVLYRTAYDPLFARDSVGSMAVLKMIEQLIEEDRVKTLDFGRDDEDYKKIWVSRQRYRKGVLLFNPRTLGGIQGLLRHALTQTRDVFVSLIKPYLKPQ